MRISPINSDSNVLSNLLTANSLTGTAFFAVTDDQNKLLMLMDPIPNSALTPDLVLAELKTFLTKSRTPSPSISPSPMYKGKAAAGAAKIPSNKNITITHNRKDKP